MAETTLPINLSDDELFHVAVYAVARATPAALRAMLGALPDGEASRTLEQIRSSRAHAAERNEAEARARLERAAFVEAKDAAENAAAIDAWREWLAANASALDEIRSSRAPSVLSAPVARWLALDERGDVLGAGETLDAAHADAISRSLRDFETPESAAEATGADVPSFALLRRVAGYARIEGSPLVEALVVATVGAFLIEPRAE